MSNQWYIKEAQNVLDLIKRKNKNEAVFQCGFGPSGLPHIGTVSEIIRTLYVIRSFKNLCNNTIATRLIVFIDDLDALRKVPSTIPYNLQKDYERFIGTPLCDIPSPWNYQDENQSYSGYSVEYLKNILHDIGIYENEHYEIRLSSECYRNGIFDKAIVDFSQRIKDIINIVTVDYSQERKNTYFPFFPIINDTTYHELHDSVLDNNVLYFTDGNDVRHEIPLNGNNVKAQWKVDWPLRWYTFDIDYEMHGKDLLNSAKIGDKIIHLFNQTPPKHMMYELFLDDEKKKVSKSKGNGTEVIDWIEYAPIGALFYLLTKNPKKSVSLTDDIIPHTVDEYLRDLEKFNDSGESNVMDIIHDRNVVTVSPVSYNMILNLVSIADTNDVYTLLRYIQNYTNTDFQNCPMLYKICMGGIRYFNKFVKPFKVYRKPTDFEIKVLYDLETRLVNYINCYLTNDIITSIRTDIFDCGKKFYSKDELREFFKMLYQVLLGQNSGPQMHKFVVTYGINNTVQYLREILEY